MRLTLFVKPVVLVCCFFLLMLVACGPALDAVAPATRRVVDATFSPTPTMVPLSAAADTLPATATIPLPEPSPTMVTAVVTATVTSLSEGQGCEQPFADVTSATEDVINEGLQRMEDSGTAALAWPLQAWDVIVDQTVAAGAIFLDECTDRDTPLAEQPERLNRLAELGRVIPQMEFTLPVEVADGGLAKCGTTFQRLRFACSTRLTRQVGHTWPCLASSTIQPAILRWDEQGPEVAMRLAWLGWCGNPPWEIGDDGQIYVLATRDFMEHGCEAVQGRVFTLGESETFTACTNDSVFVEDVNVLDGAHFAPGTAFTKTWRLRNSGSCGWGAWYALNFVSGERMDGPESLEIAETVLPGEEVDLSVALIAPQAEGTYRGQWQLAVPDGTEFGARPYVEIVVQGGEG